MAVSYRMRAFDTTLSRLVFWTATIVDTTGSQYAGPGPLTGVVIQGQLGAGSDGANNVFTWRPGSSETGPTVFNSFTALYAQLSLLRTTASVSGEFVIVFDNQFTTLTVPAATYDMTRTSWHGIPRDDATGFVPVSLPNGVTVNNLGSISGLVINGNATSACIQLVAGQSLTLRRAKLQTTGLAALVHVSGRAAIHLDDLGAINNTGGGSTTGSIAIDNSIVLDAYLDGAESSISSDAFAGGGSAQVSLIVGSSSSSYSTSQAYLAGTITLTQQATAWKGVGDPNGVITASEGLLYTDTNTGNVYRNTNGAMVWAAFGSGGGGGVTVDRQPPTHTPPVNTTNFYGSVVTPDGAHVYVGNDNNDGRDIYVFRTSDNKWTATITAGIGPRGLAITPSGAKIYSANYYTGDVTVINALTNAVITTIGGFTTPLGVAITPDGATAYVTDFGANTVVRIDVATDTILGSIVVGSLPEFIAINPAGTKAYVSLSGDPTDAVDIISTSSHTIIATVPRTGTFDSVRGIAIKSDSSKVYCVLAINNSVQIIDGTTNALTGPTISTTTNIANGLALTPSNAKLYAPQSDGSIDVIDTATNLVTVNIPTFTTSGFLNGIIPNPVSPFVYVSDGSSDGIVGVVSTVSDTVTATVTIFATPAEVTVGTFSTFNLTGSRLTDEGGGDLSVGFAVVFDDFAPGVFTNIRSTRDDQSTTDNGKSQITNFGSKDGLVKPLSTGATGKGSTIGGGNDHSAGPTGYETVAGGVGNKATGSAATVSGGRINSANADFATIAGGNTNTAASVGGTVSGGQNNFCIGVNAIIAGGSSNGTKADNAHAEGLQVSANGTASHAEGRQTIAHSNYSHAEGQSSSTQGVASHAEGQSSSTNGQGAHAEGYVTQAQGEGAHSEGRESHALADHSHAEGYQTITAGPAAHSEGIQSYASYDGQHAHSSGPGTTSGIVEQGATQHSILTMSGATLGAGVGETVELDYGRAGGLIVPGFLFDGMGLTIVVTAIARGRIGGVYRVQSFRQMFCVINDAGVSVLVASGALEQIGSAAAASWTLVGSISAVPQDHFKLEFSTGATQSLVRVTAKVELVEIYNPL